MMASTLLEHGPEHAIPLLRGIEEWLVEREYVSVDQMRGSMSQENCPDPVVFERSNYMSALTSFSSRFEWR
jgi:dihydroorotate dehydrogenase (fumarate)